MLNNEKKLSSPTVKMPNTAWEFIHLFLTTQDSVLYCQVLLSSFMMLLQRWLLRHNMLCLNMLKYQRNGCAAVYYMSCICAKSIPRACLDVNLRAGHYSLASADFVCCYRCAVLHVSVVQISRKIGSLHTHPAEPEDFVGHMPKSILKKCVGKAVKEHTLP